MTNSNANAFTSFTAEIKAMGHEPRAKNSARLVTCTKKDGGVQVLIQAEAAGYAANAPFITLSDEFIPDAHWSVVKDTLRQAPGFKVVKRG